MLYQDSRWKQMFRRGRRWEYLIFMAVLASMLYILRMPNRQTVGIIIKDSPRIIGEVSTTKQGLYENQAILFLKTNDSPKSSRTVTSAKSGTYKPTQSSSVKPLSPVISKHVVICIESGRLGNLMFTYASVYGIAKRKNMSVVIDESNPLLRYFKLDAKPVKISSLHGYRTLTETRACDFDEKVTMFDPNRDVLIQRYLQSWKYFFHVEELVRAQFQFSESTIAAADKKLSKIRQEKSLKVHNSTVTVIGLHYRRGDKVSSNFAKFGYEVAPIDYVRRAMAYFQLFHENIVFAVTSDSPDYLKSVLHGDDIVFLEMSSPIEDLATMARCDHLITTIGTFGWWAGFLNTGKVLYYKYPAREGSDFRHDFGKNYSNFFHPKWTGLR